MQKMGTRTNNRGFAKQSQKTSKIAPSSGGTKDAEVVKYMSKLPSYLQCMEEESNVLNVGVLDWARLEQWKHGRGDRSGKPERKVSSTFPNDSSSSSQQYHRCKIDEQVHASSIFGKVKASRGSSAHRVRCTLEPEFASTTNKQQEIATCSYKSSSKSTRYQKSTSVGSLGAKGNLVVDSEKRAGEIQCEQEARESREQCPENLDGEEKTVGDSNASLRFQVPRSCPLSFDLERDSQDMMLLPLSSKKEGFGGTRRHYSKTASRIFDQEDESRHPTSPNKRFGRLGTSFNFKEDSPAESIRFDGSAFPSKQEKQKIQSGSRVRPLRRLLKPKASQNVLPSKATSTSSNPKPANIHIPLEDEKKKQRGRALFQLTIRNGIPLFQFVVDDNLKGRSILGATMKHSESSSFKDNSVQYCTFYSVMEVKKKKNWLIHGRHKEKQHGFVYNVIGQMRLCNSMSSQQKVSCIIREALLVDEKDRKEVAAVVIKKKKKAVEENLKETTVIIPGGVHSFPEKGAPTPLVSRWRSGGLCDCGGWDVGCKLRVLSNKTILHELDNSFKLFDQESDQEDYGPVLEMRELKAGMYRVEFDSFLSHLQAFFVCVTVITCASEDETVSGKPSSTFAPPLSPVGRV